MRVLLIALVFVLFVGFLGFVASNLRTTVPVTVLGTTYDNAPLWLVVLIALGVMFVLTSAYAIGEGTGLRLENSRLKRELHKLETEVNYLRTQPPAAPRPEPDALDAFPARTRPVDVEQDPEPALPSAPVYGGEPDRWDDDRDPDDDIYSGGRAV
jgi:hypothetical protein